MTDFPRLRPARLHGVDLARGLAMLAMIGTHIGISGSAAFDWLTPESWGALVNERPRVLFAVLAGVSLALVRKRAGASSERDQQDRRLRLVGRGVALFAIGVVLDMVFPIEPILWVYGAVFAVLVPLLDLSARVLGVVGGVLLLAGPLLLAAMAAVSRSESSGAAGLLVYGSYPIVQFTSLVLIGFLIGRLDLRRPVIARRLLLAGAAVSALGYGVAQLVRWPLIEDPGDGSVSPWASVPEQAVSGVYVMLAPAGLAVALLGIALLAPRAALVLLAPIRAVGRMPVTIYVAHFVLFALGAGTPGEAPWTTWFIWCAGLTAGALVWSRFLGRGPVERGVAFVADRFASVPRGRRPDPRIICDGSSGQGASANSDPVPSATVISGA